MTNTAATAARLQAATPARDERTAWVWRLLTPSLCDALFVVFMGIMFMSGAGWSMLLVDGDAGLHIRMGEFVLKTHTIPAHDLFSFVTPRTPMYACWEWLSDTILAAVHGWGGFAWLVLFIGTMICLALVLLFRYMLARGVALHIALLLSILVADALRFHFFVRPHIFTTLLAVVAFCVLDRDWSKPSWMVWLMVPLTVVWTNLHGGFLVAPVSLGLMTTAAALMRDGTRLRRYGMLAAACSAATLINPYGWRLHAYILGVFGAPWLASIEEYASPSFHTEGMVKFEVLLFLGLICVAGLARRGRLYNALWIVFWGYAALSAVRHATIYMIMAVAPVADELSRAWYGWTQSRAANSFAGALRDLFRVSPSAARLSLWTPAFVGLLAAGVIPQQWPTDFPHELFPAGLMQRNAATLAGTGRILNPDHWGGYIAYHYYPARREFIDGRNDYFGTEILHDYSLLRGASGNWRELMDQYQFRYALIPNSWPLATALERNDSGWVLQDHDDVGALFERRQEAGR